MVAIVHTSRGPVLREDNLEVSRIIDVSGTGIVQQVNFPARVVWIRETTSRLIVRGVSDRILNNGSQYNDHYGLFMSAVHAVAHAGPTIEEFGATATSSIRAELECEIEDIPMILAKEQREGSSMRAYHRVPRDWIPRDDAAISAWLEANWRERDSIDLPRLHSKVTTLALWSSRDLDLSVDERNSTLATTIAPWCPDHEAVAGIADKIVGALDTSLEQARLPQLGARIA